MQILNRGKHAHYRRFFHPHTSHAETCYRMDDPIVARFRVVGTHRKRAFQLACKVKRQTLIQTLFDRGLILAAPVLLLGNHL